MAEKYFNVRNIPEKLHHRFKVACAKRGVRMNDAMKALMWLLVTDQLTPSQKMLIDNEGD